METSQKYTMEPAPAPAGAPNGADPTAGTDPGPGTAPAAAERPLTDAEIIEALRPDDDRRYWIAIRRCLPGMREAAERCARRRIKRLTAGHGAR